MYVLRLYGGSGGKCLKKRSPRHPHIRILVCAWISDVILARTCGTYALMQGCTFRRGVAVGLAVGFEVGLAVRMAMGLVVGLVVGFAVGFAVG